MIAWALGVASVGILCFGLGAVLGAPYLPVLGPDTKALLDLAQAQPGERLLDLGCGDGRLLRAAARRGIYGVGYEINPLVFALAWLWCWPQRRYISIRLGDYWRVSWPRSDVIYVFLIDRYMKKLDQQLRRRVSHPTRVVSYVFEIPGVRAVRSNRNSYVYDYPTTQK